MGREMGNGGGEGGGRGGKGGGSENRVEFSLKGKYVAGEDGVEGREEELKRREEGEGGGGNAERETLGRQDGECDFIVNGIEY